jgi:hypothetical protein
VELVLEIKRLLYEKRYTIEGARKFLDSRPKPVIEKASNSKRQGELFDSRAEVLSEVRRELAEIVSMLDSADK